MSRWLEAGWPRLAWGVAAAAVVLVAAALWLPSRTSSKSELQLARNEPAAQSRPAAAAPAPPPAPAAPAEEMRKQVDRSKLALAENGQRDQSGGTFGLERQRRLADKDESQTADQFRAQADSKLDALASANKLEREGADGLAFSMRLPSTAPTMTATPAPSSSSSNVQKEKASSPVAANEAANAPAAAAGAPALGLSAGSTPAGTSAGVLTGDTAAQKPEQYHFYAGEANVAKKPATATTQYFARTLSAASENTTVSGDKVATPPVLKSFTLEQSGRDVRVVDSDGSVYTGYLDVAENAKSLRSDGPAGALATRALQAPARNHESVVQSSPRPYSPAFFFRVTGTNQTLRQPVIFSGNLLPATNQVPVAGSTNLSAGVSGGGYGGGGAVSAGRLTIPLPLPARISGTATIGSNQTPIEATANR